MPTGRHTKIKLDVDVDTGKLSIEGDDDLHDPRADPECAHSKVWMTMDVNWVPHPTRIDAWKVTFDESPFTSGALVVGSGLPATGGTIMNPPAKPWYKYTVEYDYTDKHGNKKSGKVDPKIVIEDPGNKDLRDFLKKLLRELEELCDRRDEASIAALCELIPEAERLLRES